MARDEYVEEGVVWDDLPEEEEDVVEEAEADDAPEEVEVAAVPDPVVEAPAETVKGVVYRRLPNGALTTD